VFTAVNVIIPNFRLFSPISRGKKGDFLETQCYDQSFASTNSIMSNKRHFYRQIFRR
jgi:hypothetical protein